MACLCLMSLLIKTKKMLVWNENVSMSFENAIKQMKYLALCQKVDHLNKIIKIMPFEIIFYPKDKLHQNWISSL